MRVVLRACAVSLAVFAAGCTTSGANRDSPEYQAGYSDGCTSGGARGSQTGEAPVRQEDAWQQSGDYRAGWSAGYHVCGASANPARF